MERGLSRGVSGGQKAGEATSGRPVDPSWSSPPSSICARPGPARRSEGWRRARPVGPHVPRHPSAPWGGAGGERCFPHPPRGDPSRTGWRRGPEPGTVPLPRRLAAPAQGAGCVPLAASGEGSGVSIGLPRWERDPALPPSAPARSASRRADGAILPIPPPRGRRWRPAAVTSAARACRGAPSSAGPGRAPAGPRTGAGAPPARYAARTRPRGRPPPPARPPPAPTAAG